MEAEDKLIGYDIREMWLGLSDWPQERRDQHTLKPNIEKLLSVDTMVWKSVFDIHPYATLPNFCGAVQSLWENIDEMRQFFSPISSISQPSWTIAITLCLASLTKDEIIAFRGTFDFVSFNPTDYSAKFIGYDVADRFLGSGLVDTVYPAIEKAGIKQKWADRLNKNHLFTDYALANEYRQLINPLVKHHAPFFVYGLYLIAA